MPASRSAAAAVLCGEGPRTAISTSGVWPAFCSSPLTAVIVIPLRSCFVVIPVAAATRRIVASAWVTSRTVLGFVASVCRSPPPFGVSGWPR